MTSTKKIYRKLHNDKIRKEAGERDRVRMLKNDSKGHPSVARFFRLPASSNSLCSSADDNTSDCEHHSAAEILPVNQVAVDAREGKSSVFDSDDAHQFTDNAMEHGRDLFPKLQVQLKNVPLELEDGYNVDDTAGDAIAELDGEVGLGGRETGNGLGREHQHVEVRPPAQQRNVVGNSSMVSLSLQELMLRNQMAMFAYYMRRNLQAPNFPAAIPLPLPVNRKRPADALPITVAGETIAAMTGFIPDLHREKRRTRGKGKRTRQPPTCVYCRDSSDPEVRNSAKIAREDGQEVHVKGNDWDPKIN
ncbi:hypothetical protein IV203_005827 [Nitzschia inconspicua]|uniref:Uncharacterized protein n=1 Tax=Nitzschia inconspicua TaxID=303405 RepID=A0A9K3KPJ6_9STRA|nr:hypothetical protein IV203_005827 [Nitzschia inconspicua]